MRILILGGTLFLGRHLAEAALARGHRLTVINRGRTACDLPPGVMVLRGDRDRDMDALRDQHFDVVIDTSAYHPTHIERVAASLGGTGHYILVSTASVYSHFPATEASPTHPSIRDEAVRPGPSTYAGLKRGCEESAEAAFGPRLTVIRPGLIVGPYDPTNRFEYWVRRSLHDGPMLAPGDSQRTIQVLDARDLASWILEISGTTFGVFNAAGPRDHLTMDHLLSLCITVGKSSAQPIWVSDKFLLEHDVTPWSELPLWIPDEAGPLLQVDSSRAVAAGLDMRPLTDTIRDVLQTPTRLKPLAGGLQAATPIDPTREGQLLTAWTATAPPNER